ncbi:MAG: glycosyltransferase family 39 protein [Candidatus Saganbacteria bacterium]|nr:glycosyltransferase family 39 protein [Candidatus Saganbacteria bacterium]
MKLSYFAKGLVFVLVITCLVGALIFTNRILAGDAFDREEASHGLYSMWIWRDLTRADWSAFWYDTGRQMVWPFLHSWIQAGFFMIFGVGYASARALSLILFALSILLVYLLANKLSARQGWQIGSLTALLMLSSPLMLSFASENMIEPLGAVLFLGATYLYLICEERKLTLFYAFLAVAIGLSIYTHYVYAFLMMPAFLVATLIKLEPVVVDALKLKKRGEISAMSFVWWAYKKLIVLGVILVLAGIWFSFNFSRRFFLMLDTLLRSGAGQGLGWLQSLIYYPKLIVTQLTFSPWLGLFILAALFLPFTAKYYEGLKKLYVFVWTVIILAALVISTKAPRIIYIIMPFIFMIFSAVFFNFFERLNLRDKRLAWLLVLALFLPSLVSLPKIFEIYGPQRPGQSMISVLDYFAANVPAGAEIGSLINLRHFNDDVLRFHFRDWDDRVLSHDILENGRGLGGDVYLLTFELERTSPYQKDLQNDSLYRWNAWLKDQESSGQVLVHSARHFERIGLTARIYRSKPL